MHSEKVSGAVSPMCICTAQIYLACATESKVLIV